MVSERDLKTQSDGGGVGSPHGGNEHGAFAEWKEGDVEG